MADPSDISAYEQTFACGPGELIVSSACNAVPADVIGEESVFAVLVDDGPIGWFFDDGDDNGIASDSISDEAFIASANSVVALTVVAAGRIARSGLADEVGASLAIRASADGNYLAAIGPISAVVLGGLSLRSALGDALAIDARFSISEAKTARNFATAIGNDSADSAGARIGVGLANAHVILACLRGIQANSAAETKSAVVIHNAAVLADGIAVVLVLRRISLANCNASGSGALISLRATLSTVVRTTVRVVGDRVASSGAKV